MPHDAAGSPGSPDEVLGEVAGLARLVAVVPPPRGWDGSVDWDDVATQLGCAVPSGVQAMMDLYGPSILADAMVLHHPATPGSDALVAAHRQVNGEEVPGLWELRDYASAELGESRPVLLPLFFNAAGEAGFVLVDNRGGGAGGVSGSDPDSWPCVLLDADLGRYELHRVSPVELVLRLISGQLRTSCFTEPPTRPLRAKLVTG